MGVKPNGLRFDLRLFLAATRYFAVPFVDFRLSRRRLVYGLLFVSLLAFAMPASATRVTVCVDPGTAN
jgi:hypothetical protein